MYGFCTRSGNRGREGYLRSGRPCQSSHLAADDAFRNGPGRLGQRAGQIYERLLDSPASLAELVRATGASRWTVGRALKQLSNVKDYRTGEVVSLVELDGERWRALRWDLSYIAAMMGTYGKRGRQHEQHMRERRSHQATLALGRIKSQMGGQT